MSTHVGRCYQAIVGVVIAFAVLINHVPAQAQQADIDTLKAQIAELSLRLQKLEQSQKDEAEAAKKVAPVTIKSGLGLQISGDVQLQANSFTGEDGANYPRQQDTFRIRRADIRLTLPKITDRISGTILFDLGRGVGLSNGSATPSSLSFSSSILSEAQLTYLLRKAKQGRDNHYLDVGQFKIPIGYEGDLSPITAVPVTERALFYRARDVAGGGTGDVRDTGVQLRGSFSNGQLAYWLGVFNGLGERQNQQAGGDPKAIVTRLVYKPTGISGLQLGVSAGRGNTRIAPSSATDTETRFERALYNAFAVYKKNKWTLQTEYLTGHGQKMSGAIAAHMRGIQGYYGHAGYLFTPKIEAVLRYDTFNFDRHIDDADVKELTAGINYYIKGNYAKIQADIVRVQGGSGLTKANGFGSGSQGEGFQNDRTEFRLQSQFAF